MTGPRRQQKTWRLITAALLVVLLVLGHRPVNSPSTAWDGDIEIAASDHCSPGHHQDAPATPKKGQADCACCIACLGCAHPLAVLAQPGVSLPSAKIVLVALAADGEAHLVRSSRTAHHPRAPPVS